jgi:hypothetical protein
MLLVQVLPQDIGWTVVGGGEPLFFRSGRWAEQAGRRLAAALAATRGSVELCIRDRSGEIAGRLCFA